MRVAFLTTRTEKPSFRFRVRQFLPYLRAKGVACDTFTFPRATLPRWRLFRSLDRYDIVFIQKKMLRLADRLLLRSSARKLIYDVDDALIYRERGDGRSAQRERLFRAMVRMSDCVLAGNDFLCGLAATDAKNVVYFPTVVDTDRYSPSVRKRHESCVLGWSGSRSTNRYLNTALPVLARLAGRHRLALCIVSDTREGIAFPLAGGLVTEFFHWDSASEVSKIQGFDIGLMPLPANEWARGKCALKALLYMACGVPAICSAVGESRKIINDGENGFLASSDEDWFNKIELLLRDEQLRSRMVESGRETVVKRYSVSARAPQLLEIFTRLQRSEHQ